MRKYTLIVVGCVFLGAIGYFFLGWAAEGTLAGAGSGLGALDQGPWDSQRSSRGFTGNTRNAQSFRQDDSGRLLKAFAEELSSSPEVRSELPPRALACNPNEPDCGDCRIDSDCPENQACLVDPDERVHRCFESSCSNNSDCASGQTCQFFGFSGQKVPPKSGVYRCVESTIAVGSECESVHPLESGCVEGAACVFGLCLGQCEKNSDCGSSEQCVEAGGHGRVCRAQCPQCGPGEYCDELETAGQCYKMSGVDCRGNDICEEGQTCVRNPDSSTGVLHMACRWTCDPAGEVLGGRLCPDGFVCGFGRPGFCYQACDLDGPNTCEDGYVCATVTEIGDTFGCFPLPGM